MGSLVGHVVPGLGLLLYGLLWISLSHWLNLTKSDAQRQRLESKRRCGTSNCKIFLKDDSRSYIPFPICPRIPLEPLGKIFLPLLAISFELLLKNKGKSAAEGKNNMVFEPWNGIYNKDGEFNILDKLDHITMYLGFILSGIVDLLLLCLKDSKPVKAQLFFSLALGIEGYVFYFHGASRASLDATVHKLYVCAVLASVLFSFSRVFYSKNLAINLGLGISLALQGTWLIQIGYVLYGKKHWERENHRNMQFVVDCFMWHVLIHVFANFVVYYILAVACHSRSKHRVKEETEEEQVMESLIDSNSSLTVTNS